MDVKEVFSLRIRQLRESLKMSQQEFSNKIGVSRATISYYEQGHRVPDIEVLNAIHTATGCSISFLMGYSDARNDENALAVANLGLSEDAVETLKSLRKKSIHSKENPSNTLSLLRILDVLLCFPSFHDMLYAAGMVCDPTIVSLESHGEDAYGHALSAKVIWQSAANNALQVSIQQLSNSWDYMVSADNE